MEQKLFDRAAYASCARQNVAEGIVLLKNDREALPLKKGTRIALFGRNQFNYYKSGTGSGGLVNTRYVVSVRDALKKDARFHLDEKLNSIYQEWLKEHPFDQGHGWASEPWYQEEMPITEEIAREASGRNDVAVVLIGRTAGEDQDNANVEGSFLLTGEEERMLSWVTGAFPKTIVLLNTGNIIDMRFVAKYDPAAVAYVWQGGQEGGNGVLDVLSGDVNPSGKLTDTIAEKIEDYPSTANFGGKVRNVQQEDIYVGYRYFETFAKDQVLYPFGFGLSYTSFTQKVEAFKKTENGAEVTVKVTNIGDRAGKEVVQVYVEAPQGILGKPLRSLAGFSKTEEIPAGGEETVTIPITDYEMASYDDEGRAGHASCYVMEAGDYVLYAGSDVRSTKEAGRFTLAETKVVEKLSRALAPEEGFTRMKPVLKADGTYEVSYEEVKPADYSPQDLRKENLPVTYEQEERQEKKWKLQDVAEGKCSMETFIAQLSDEDLSCIVRGEGMNSPKVTPGCGGAFGGVTDSLLSYGIPIVCVTDGPSGIRMDSGATAFSLPNGACLASGWNPKLQEELFAWEGMELRKNHIDALLGPGMNLHRNPLNGRNFEYFSEDPLVSGKSAAAQLRGLHRYGVTGTIKHFAMNTQEAGRTVVEHLVSERAARELYLRGFEIAVKEGNADSVMTTYGIVNGYYTASNYDLVTRILRGEWGFTGIVMTDWWAKGNDEKEEGTHQNMAAMIRAQNDLNMVTACAEENTTHDNSLEALAAGKVTRGEYQRSAMNICRFILRMPVFARMIGVGNKLDIALMEEADEEQRSFDKMIKCRVGGSGTCQVDLAQIDTVKGASTRISVSIRERGIYKLQMRIRAKDQETLAQIPMTIYQDKQVLKQITLTGADKEWQDVEVELSPCYGSFFITLYFAQAGMEFAKFEIILEESLEKKLQEELAKREAAMKETQE